jgi:hypothetical protein
VTPDEARILLDQAIHARADHAAFVSIAVRQRRGGITLTWCDYLTREEGPLAVVSDQDIEASVSHLVAALQQWRANALPPKKPAQTSAPDPCFAHQGKRPNPVDCTRSMRAS